MGNRLHVAKTYKVKYGETAAFNWKVEEFHNLLSALDVYYYGEVWDATFDVVRDELQEGLDKLKNFDNLDEDTKEDIEMSLEELTYSREEVIDLLEKYIQESDQETDVLHFSFF